MKIQGRLLIDPSRRPELGVIEVGAAGADGVGRIGSVRFGEPSPGETADVGSRDALVVPAFTDAHFHVPQVDSVGCDGMELLEWLERVIFPAEAWWGRGGALSCARAAARRLMEAGTAGVAGYLTSHAEGGAEAVALFANRTGLRFHLGRSAMDRGGPEELTREDVERASMTPAPSPLLAAGEGAAWRAGGDGACARANVSANPRYALSCGEELLAEIGWAVREREAALGRGVWVQTHLSESVREVELVGESFPDAAHYTGVYDAAGLVGPRTLLAHCLHLSEAEWGLIAERDAVVVHCPGANTFLGAGVFDWNAARRHGVRVGLGSDVAAGPDVAMPSVARQMIEVAKLRRMTLDGGAHVPSPAEAWDLITRVNAELLGWGDAGRIEAGCRADLLVLRVPETWFDEHLVGRLIYGWDASRIVSRVYSGVVSDPADV